MDERHEDALLERSPSTDTVTEQRRRSANGKALKVTGLTVLACLLLAGQAFTAYFVMKQKGNLQALETGQNNLKKEMSRMLKAAPKIMQTSSNKMPLMMATDDGSRKQRIPLTRLQSASFQLQKEGSGLVEGSRVASKSIMASKALLTDFSQDKLEEEAKTPGPSAAVVETKCKIEAKQIKPGFYQPQCDEEGNFKPMQCWHSTGYCWCVDKDGKEIPDTLSRKPIDCGNVN